MAIDTALKRASVLGFAFVATLLIVPSGAITAADRETACNLYGGIAAAAPSVAPSCYQASLSIMRNTTVPTIATMRNTAVPTIGAMANVLPIIAEMRNTVVASQGTMRNTPVGSQADLC